MKNKTPDAKTIAEFKAVEASRKDDVKASLAKMGMTVDLHFMADVDSGGIFGRVTWTTGMSSADKAEALLNVSTMMGEWMKYAIASYLRDCGALMEVIVSAEPDIDADTVTKH